MIPIQCMLMKTTRLKSKAMHDMVNVGCELLHYFIFLHLQAEGSDIVEIKICCEAKSQHKSLQSFWLKSYPVISLFLIYGPEKSDF